MRAGDKVVQLNDNGEKDFSKIYTVSHFYKDSTYSYIKILGSNSPQIADNFVKLKEQEYLNLKILNEKR